MEIRAVEAQRKRPTVLVAVAVALVAAIAGLGIFLYRQHQETQAKELASIERDRALRAEVDATLTRIADLDAEKEQRFESLLNAKTVEEKAQAQRDLEATEQKLAAQKEALKRLREQNQEREKREQVREDKRREENKKVKVKCDPSDPLCGL
jgi:hypothetical protein